MALYDAYHNMLDRINRRQYEELLPDINEIRKTLDLMKDYKRSNWK
ncbi:MAG: hypothetical protein J6T10_18075 [Methanobrevibacter sp.]|nr:hypothetical protein [Methanobrevibacter sp.]